MPDSFFDIFVDMGGDRWARITLSITAKGTRADGEARLGKAGSPTARTLKAQGAQTACGDSDGDGAQGVQRITVALRGDDGRTVQGVLRPVKGEVDDPGTHDAILELDGERIPAKLRIRHGRVRR